MAGSRNHALLGWNSKLLELACGAGLLKNHAPRQGPGAESEGQATMGLLPVVSHLQVNTARAARLVLGVQGGVHGAYGVVLGDMGPGEGAIGDLGRGLKGSI